MAGQCAEADCSFWGERLICYDCLGPDWHLKPPGFFEIQARCAHHDMEHRQHVHGKAPEPVKCTGCGKDLGTFTDIRSPAGAPWCGECSPWWFSPREGAPGR